MLVKSHTSVNHIDDLEETFTVLHKYHIKLNPTKCTFRVISRKFLGFMVSHQGIEANLKKIQAMRQISAHEKCSGSREKICALKMVKEV